MGVPSLYKWLTQKFPEIRLKTEDFKETVVDNLYLDFNAVIHPCCNKSLNSMKETDLELYGNLVELLDDVMVRMNPRRMLYIAIDGVAPRAKLNQQRSRRFTSAKKALEEGKRYFKDDLGGSPIDFTDAPESDAEEAFKKKEGKACEKNEDESLNENEVFDANSITPGTDFMQRLDVFMQELISYKISTEEKWKAINVIYSSCRVPGEGEQKIMQFIRNNQPKNQTSVILSPDADVIFLGLTLFDYKVYILREEPRKNGGSESYMLSSKRDYSIVDISKLKNLLIKEFKGLIKIPFDHRRFLEDWILLCFSVGNDFLPSSPCFEIRTNALEKLTNIMKVVYARTKSYITDHGKINFDILREFFKECALREDQYIVEKRSNMVSARQRMSIPMDPSKEFFMDNERGKIRFYVEKMGIKSEDELLDACIEYIKGWVWVYNYYFYEIQSWDWFYPYHFSPFMTDLANVKNMQAYFPKSKPLRPMEQLLAVLPPLSKDLLPECLHGVFEQHKEMYPEDFVEDMFQKCMDWQAVAILPFIDTKKLTASFEQCQNKLSFAECERNLTVYPIMFSAQPKVVAKAHPLYTNLLPCEFLDVDGCTFKIFPANKINPIGEEIRAHGFHYVNRAVTFTFDQRKPLKREVKKIK